MDKITVLNAFAGLGGVTHSLDRDRYRITHIEHNPDRVEYLKENYPRDLVLECDAYQYILDNVMRFNIIWASPDCESHSSIRWANRGRVKEPENFTYVYPDLRLYSLIILLQRARLDKPWMVENVRPYYEPLILPTAKVGKYYIWSNCTIEDNFNFPSNEHNKDPDKERRDRMNPDIGKYLFDQIKQPQQYKLTEFF